MRYISRLLSPEDLRYCRDNYIAAEDRRTGRSTVIALNLISSCIDNPGKVYAIYDHALTPGANWHLAQLVREYVGKLELKFFVFTGGIPNTVTCNLLYTEEELTEIYK